jgi:hypothetical protein
MTDTETWLIWSNHHKLWWGPGGNHYYRDVSNAGRYQLDGLEQWLGRGCGCCKVPEVLVSASAVDAPEADLAKVIRAATREAVKAGRTNRYAEAVAQ